MSVAWKRKNEHYRYRSHVREYKRNSNAAISRYKQAFKELPKPIGVVGLMEMAKHLHKNKAPLAMALAVLNKPTRPLFKGRWFD